MAAPMRGAAGQDWKQSLRASFELVWTTVNETFYDPSFGGLDWPAVRAELDPKLEAADTPEAARDVIRAMIERLGRSHFTLITGGSAGRSWPGAAVVSIDFRMSDGGTLVTRVDPSSSAFRAGLQAGDVLLSIDGQPVPGASAPLPAGRRERLILWQDVYRRLHGAPASVVEMTRRTPHGDVETIAVQRELDRGEVVSLGNLPALPVRIDVTEARTPAGRRAGVIGFTAWMAAIAQPFADAVDRFRQADGIVLDLRGNPGGLADMIRGIAGHFVATPVLLGRVQMRGVELELRANPRRSTSDGRRVEPYGGPVALLVDDMTASASECFAGGMQSLGRVRVFGTRTAGQALPASTRQLPNGDVLMYAVGDFVTSTGARLEGVGVVPDEEIPLTPEGLAGGRDPALAAALAWLDSAANGR